LVESKNTKDAADTDTLSLCCQFNNRKIPSSRTHVYIEERKRVFMGYPEYKQ